MKTLTELDDIASEEIEVAIERYYINCIKTIKEEIRNCQQQLATAIDNLDKLYAQKPSKVYDDYISIKHSNTNNTDSYSNGGIFR